MARRVVLAWAVLAGVVGVAAVGAAVAPPAQACTAFLVQADGAVVVGKSYDWDSGRGEVLTNLRGLEKAALVLEPGVAPATWTSRYASLTFNQYGRELPNGGMNERGLVVEVLWLSSSVFAPPDGRPSVNELQWIQRQLDLYATVDEVVAHAAEVRVAPVYARVHYLACDAGGACATFEHLDGRLVVTRGDALTPRVLTNDSYARSRRAYDDAWGQPAPAGGGSLPRFVRAGRAVASFRGRADALVPFAWRVLGDVAQGDYSKWRIVYEPGARRVGFQTVGGLAVKTVELGRLAQGCDAPARRLPLDAAGGAGDATERFAVATAAANRALVRASLGELGGALPEAAIEAVAGLPERSRCALAAPAPR